MVVNGLDLNYLGVANLWNNDLGLCLPKFSTFEANIEFRAWLGATPYQC